MTDEQRSSKPLLSRLRDGAKACEQSKRRHVGEIQEMFDLLGQLMTESAEEIERLHGEVDHLLGLLKERGKIIDRLRAPSSEASACTSNLLPCPFCGGETECGSTRVAPDEDRFWIICNACWTTSDNYLSPERAFEAWNKRASSEPSDAPEYVADDAHDAKKCAPIERIYRDAYNEFAGPPQYRHAVNFDTYNRAGLIALWNAARRSPPPKVNLEADPNAPWLTIAHTICTDAGIPQGHIWDRMIALAEKLRASEPPPARLLRPLLATFQQSHGVNPQELWVLNRFVNWVDEPLLAPTKEGHPDDCDCYACANSFLKQTGHYPTCGVYEGTQRGPCNCKAHETSAPRVEDIGQKLVVSASRDLLARARSTLFVFTGEDFDMGDAAEATQLVTEIDRLLDLTSSGDTVSETPSL